MKLLPYRRWGGVWYDIKYEGIIGVFCRNMAKHTHFWNMWYVIQTETGKEQELLNSILLLVNRDSFERCFYIRRENIWRLRGECKLHVEKMFPGYVFVVTETPQLFYEQLKHVPMLSKMLGREEMNYYSISAEEEEFLKSLLLGDSEDIVRLSPVLVNGESNIVRCGGALRNYKKNIVKKRVRMRYVLIRVNLFEQEREIKLGIQLPEDSELSRMEFVQRIEEENVGRQTDETQVIYNRKKEYNQLSVDMDEQRSVDEESLWEQLLPANLKKGSYIRVCSEQMEGLQGMVTQIDYKKHTICMDVEMFGRTQSVELDENVIVQVVEEM